MTEDKKEKKDSAFEPDFWSTIGDYKPPNFWSIGGYALVEHWQVDAPTIIKFIHKYGLPALDTRINKILKRSPWTSEAASQLSRLWRGSVEEQKEALNYLRFRPCDIELFENQYGDVLEKLRQQVVFTVQEDKEEANEIKDYESVIRSLQVSYVNNTEIKIKVGNRNQRSRIYSHDDLGFHREDSRAWIAFIRILESRDHLHYVGKAHGSGRVRNKSYDTEQKILYGISEKFVSFLNKTYQMQLPEKYKVYELMRGEQKGIYRFKFAIKKHSDDDIEDYKKLSKDELLSQIKTLSEQCGILSNKGDEAAETKTDKTRGQLYSAVEIACKKGWLAKNRARSYLNPQDDPPTC